MRVAHTSDLHFLQMDRDLADDLEMAHRLVDTVRAAAADLLVVAGDLFDHNRGDAAHAALLLDVLSRAGTGTVVLPGNHDPLVDDSIYRRVELPARVHVLGLDRQQVAFPELDLELVGQAHLSYGNFDPIAPSRARVQRHRITVAHGHYQGTIDPAVQFLPAWLFTDAVLDQVDADYVALGHWDRQFVVRDGSPTVHYSGSPWLVGMVNLVSFEDDRLSPVVTRHRLVEPVRSVVLTG